MSFENVKEKILYFKLKQKDKDAFIKAYDLYIDDIYRFVFFKVGNSVEAEDITSQVFLKAWEYIQNNSLKDYKTLKALFYRIARNLIIDYYRKKSIRLEVSLENNSSEILGLKDKNSDISEKLEIKFDYKKIEVGLLELKDEYREIIVLRYVNELTIKEIAKVLDKKTGNVRVLVYRAVNALKKVL
ncbi:RNA polymerase sigma factor [Candidatus Parcubacteria bacterium]|nr:RNA polymerase sigma factor [Candidatus Parcubacteria bacterium]